MFLGHDDAVDKEVTGPTPFPPCQTVLIPSRLTPITSSRCGRMLCILYRRHVGMFERATASRSAELVAGIPVRSSAMVKSQLSELHPICLTLAPCGCTDYMTLRPRIHCEGLHRDAWMTVQAFRHMPKPLSFHVVPWGTLGGVPFPVPTPWANPRGVDIRNATAVTPCATKTQPFFFWFPPTSLLVLFSGLPSLAQSCRLVRIMIRCATLHMIRYMLLRSAYLEQYDLTASHDQNNPFPDSAQDAAARRSSRTLAYARKTTAKALILCSSLASLQLYRLDRSNAEIIFASLFLRRRGKLTGSVGTSLAILQSHVEIDKTIGGPVDASDGWFPRLGRLLQHIAHEALQFATASDPG